MNNRLILATALMVSFQAISQALPPIDNMRDPFIPLQLAEVSHEIPMTNPVLAINQPENPFTEKMIKLTAIKADEALRQLTESNNGLLSADAIVSSHNATNSLVIKELKQRLPLIEAWLKQLDIPKQQVQITAHIISSSRTALQELGLEWGMLSGSPNNSRYQRYNRYDSSSGQFNFNLLKLGEGLLELKLNALEKENLLSIIASPRLMASHQHPASIQQGAEIPYITSTEKKRMFNSKTRYWGWR